MRRLWAQPFGRTGLKIAAAAVAQLALLWPSVVSAPPAAVAAATAAGDPASLVDPFNGTAAEAADFGTGGGAGNTFPGAVDPFGMVQFSPDTLPGQAAFGGGYTYGDSQIKAFSLKHLSGPGCSAYQDVPITPTMAPISASPAKPFSTDLKDTYTSTFDHAHEHAAPGNYQATLNPGSKQPINAQLTATTRSGAARFTFTSSPRASILVNASGSAMGTRDARVQIDPARHELTGSLTSGQFCYQRNHYRLFFVAEFSRPFSAYGTWQRQVLAAGSTSGSDAIPTDPYVYQPIPGGPQGDAKDGGVTAQTGGYVTFDTSRDPVVEMRVGLSFVSLANARSNLAAESAGQGFDTIRARARTSWDQMLGQVQVSGGSLADRRLFYTELYHALIDPGTFSDANGQYMGFDGRVHVASGRVQYADFSGWDIYRTQLPLVAMLAPKRASDMVASLLADYQQSGSLPKWPQANGHTNLMVGDPADPLIAGAYAFGARSFDAQAALTAMVNGATRYAPATTTPTYYERPGLPDYLRYGYVPHEDNANSSTIPTFLPEMVWGSVSTTLEYALDDFSIAQLAASLGRPATCAVFERRSGNWRNVFDPGRRLMQPRYRDGAFKPESPTDGEGFVEGDAAQYTFFVPQDPAGLIAGLGGRDAARARLDVFFAQLNAGPNQPYAFLGNEPTLDTPWLYDWAGQPYKTEQVVRRALLQLYADTPAGMPGNDDLGTMASWWVLGALGVYPAIPGTDVLALGSPLFPRVLLHLGGGTFTIQAPAAAPDHPYVQAISLDGALLAKPWLRFSEIQRGGTLTVALSNRPDVHFGAGAADAPPSFPSTGAPAVCP